MRTAELPHETAIRECEALADRRDWSPSASLIADAAAFAGISEDHAALILRSCVSFRGGYAAAMSFEAREGLPFAADMAFLRYATAVDAVAARPVQEAA